MTTVFLAANHERVWCAITTYIVACFLHSYSRYTFSTLHRRIQACMVAGLCGMMKVVVGNVNGHSRTTPQARSMSAGTSQAGRLAASQQRRHARRLEGFSRPCHSRSGTAGTLNGTNRDRHYMSSKTSFRYLGYIWEPQSAGLFHIGPVNAGSIWCGVLEGGSDTSAPCVAAQVLIKYLGRY